MMLQNRVYKYNESHHIIDLALDAAEFPEKSQSYDPYLAGRPRPCVTNVWSTMPMGNVFVMIRIEYFKGIKWICGRLAEKLALDVPIL